MIHAFANAKINLTLDVLGKLPNGYHELDMLMQSVSLADELTFEDADSFSFTVDGEAPANDSNLVMKAAHMLSALGEGRCARIRLKKNAPMEAGLGGGSADAAATILSLNWLWNLGLSDEAMLDIGLSIGADVPFCLHGGTMRARGVGERLSPAPPMPDAYIVLCKPCKGVLTKDVFQALRLSSLVPGDRPDTEKALNALERSDLSGLCAHLKNVLEPITFSMRPEAAAAISALRERGALAARMTGSGPTVFGIFADEESANRALNNLPADVFKTVCRPARKGVIIRSV